MTSSASQPASTAVGDHRRLLILTPVLFSAGTGAAVYYPLLTTRLQELGWHVGIVSDREAGSGPGEYFPLFPKRSARARRPLLDRLAYLGQYLKYLALPGVVGRFKPDVVLVHDSFYDRAAPFDQIVRHLRSSLPSTRWVGDVRSTLVPLRRLSKLRRLDAVIACSENVAGRLREAGVPNEKIVHIPVVQEELHVDEEAAATFRASLGLHGIQYVFYAGLLKERKGIDLLLRSFVHHVARIRPSWKLVIAGLLKTRNREIIQLLEHPRVLYVGNRPRTEILHLISGAALCINVSPNESISRLCLEALALNRPVLLAPNVPEFERSCPDFVARERDPKAIAHRIVTCLESAQAPHYPIETHYPEAVMERYTAVLTGR